MAGMTERASRGAPCAVGLPGRRAISLPAFAAGKENIAVEWPVGSIGGTDGISLSRQLPASEAQLLSQDEGGLERSRIVM